VRFLSGVSVLAQRRPGVGPQGVPVNKSAVSAGVVATATDPAWRLIVEGAVERPLSLSLDELRALPQHEATLPIACVEGWSTSARWSGVRVRDLVALAGGPDSAEATVESLQEGGRYRRSELNRGQLSDPDTLLAVELGGEPLHLDHGFPVRLIGPNRPGVMQTKWVARVTVR
jgi:DMSO/TMAO reductase YedYZ molybdopterin-dependent catalytic subunit